MKDAFRSDQAVDKIFVADKTVTEVEQHRHISSHDLPMI